MKLLKYSEINKILIIRFSSMGDCILASHFVRSIRNRFPEAEIDFAIASQFSELYKYNPHIKHLIIYEKKSSIKQINSLKEQLKAAGKYDLIIDLQNNLRSRLFRAGLGKTILKIRKRRLHKLFLVYLKNSPYKAKFIPEIYFDSGRVLGIEDDGKGSELWLKNEENQTYHSFTREVHPESFHNPVSITAESELALNPDNSLRIAIAPGARHFTKRLPAEKFVEFIEKMAVAGNYEFLLLGGSNDEIICRSIKSACRNDIRDLIEDCSGSISILQTAKIIDKCHVLITNDTGLMHLAAALQIPAVAVFGSTIKEFGFSPYRSPHVIIEKNIHCRPCTHIGRDRCPRGHFECMNGINSQELVDATNYLLFPHTGINGK